MGFSLFRQLTRLVNGAHQEAIPFVVREIENPDAKAAELFHAAFGASIPTFPRHFTAMLRRNGSERIAAYVNLRAFDEGVFLCGGLCVDPRVYRLISEEERSRVAAEGSLSRWLSKTAIASLGRKRAVFAYSGDTRSRRDAAALGFVATGSPHLLVQWHHEPQESRHALVRRVEAMGAF